MSKVLLSYILHCPQTVLLCAAVEPTVPGQPVRAPEQQRPLSRVPQGCRRVHLQIHRKVPQVSRGVRNKTLTAESSRAENKNLPAKS